MKKDENNPCATIKQEYNSIMEVMESDEVFKLRPELLIHPNIPKPLHGVAPRKIMGQKQWDIERRKAYAVGNYVCHACGVFAPYDVVRKRFEDVKLHAHEVYDIDYESKEMKLKEIVALCVPCHDSIHSGRMNALYDKGVLNEEDCWLILAHGERVLGGLTPFPPDARDYTTEWDKWVLVVQGKEYKSKFKSMKEWEEHYK